MLRIARSLGMTLIAMLAISGVASAHNFKSTATGNLKAVSNQNQVFSTGIGSTVTCKKVTIAKGTASTGEQLHVLVEIHYDECKAEGFGLKLEAAIHLAQYLFNADNELVKLENTIVILIPGICQITVKPQDLKAVLYKTSGKHVVVEPHVSGITSEGSGSVCGSGVSTTGTYTGNTEVEVEGGEISWS